MTALRIQIYSLFVTDIKLSKKASQLLEVKNGFNF